MKTISARTAKNEFGAMLDAIHDGPVTITRHERPVGVMVSVADYARLIREPASQPAARSPRDLGPFVATENGSFASADEVARFLRMMRDEE
jgi:prevent-host-death family protein